MSDDTNAIIHEAYSDSEDHYYEIYQNSLGQFDVWFFRYDTQWNGYHALDQHRLLTESLEEAKAQGDAMLLQLG